MNPIKGKRTKQKIKNNTKYSIPFKDNVIRVEAPAHEWERHLKFCIDFLLPKGTPIIAARSGTVIACQDRYKRSYKSPKFAGRRNFIIIRHTNGENSVYVHLKYRSIQVKKGQRVKRGQVIALSGQVGFATHPHLHFGVYRGVPWKGGVSIKVPFDKKYRAPEIPLRIAEHSGKYL
jgi:murein DD-endopeptidase MepM/ murein hydrolase activator NlpD